jgi:hypothetical protein
MSLMVDVTTRLPPTQFGEQDAYLWFRAVSDQRAYHEGQEQAQKEAAGFRRLAGKQGRPEA